MDAKDSVVTFISVTLHQILISL